MELSLAENISELRKSAGLTQAQLAEGLGVSVAAVSKWERGAAVPELAMLVELAELFGVSVDALIGYAFRDGRRNALVERLKGYLHHREDPRALPEVEKALRRYPNDFAILYYSAENYRLWGICSENAAHLQRARELYGRACLLISQNTDPEISEISLWQGMADIEIALGRPEEGVRLLQAHNPCRINHPLIGQTLAGDCNDPRRALPYLSLALPDLAVAHIRVVMGYLNLYCKGEDWDGALALLEWALAFYPGLKRKGQASCLDKGEAVLWAALAYVQIQRGETSRAAHCLDRGRQIARQFDAAPCYQVSSLRFVAEETVASAVDDLGPTALEGVEKLLAELDSEELWQLWREGENEE